MKTYIATLRGTSPYSQSKYHATPALDREAPDEYEKRTWRERMHVTKDGYIFMPPMSFKYALDGATKILGMKIKGKGSQTYAKHFLSGVMVNKEVPLPYKKDEVEGEWLFVPSDGVHGSGKRVSKCFCKIPEGWEVKVPFTVIDDTVTEEIFRQHLVTAGTQVGLCRFRPARGGYYGRFEVVDIEVVDGAV